MAEDLEKKASYAFLDEDFELAAELYSQALSMDPQNALLLANRSQANIKLKKFTEAVEDANKAIELDPSLSKAYMRKGIACMELEEYETAKVALKAGATLDPQNSKFEALIKDCDKRIAEEMNASSNASSSSSKHSAPSVPIENGLTQMPANGHQGADAPESKPSYRHEFYQSSNEVVLTIFVKGVRADCVTVDFGEQMLSVTIDHPSGDKYHFQPRLFAKIIPQKCRYAVLSTKIEIRLFKAETIQWVSIEYKSQPSIPRRLSAPAVEVKAIKPAYPSSKPKGIDWDKLEAEVKKEEKNEKLDGDAALNKLFRDIYSSADEDTRRAMQKSFIESNGTVLSTNWKDVGSKRVEGSPPDGMEMRKWES